MGIDNEEESFPLLSRKRYRREGIEEEKKKKMGRMEDEEKEEEEREEGGSDKCGKGRLHKV